VEANSTGGQGSRRAVAPSDDDDDDDDRSFVLFSEKTAVRFLNSFSLLVTVMETVTITVATS
jgi:hypothetical protein